MTGRRRMEEEEEEEGGRRDHHDFSETFFAGQLPRQTVVVLWYGI